MDRVELIKAEIERLKEEVGIGLCEYDMGEENGKWQILSQLQEFIAALPKEQIIGGQVFCATDVEQLYDGKVYIISNLVQDTEFGLSVNDKVKMVLIKE